ncbi:uncharacterized protein LOC128958326 [Oppia nitens]|uniref:uncharacterized protein LOC128958326 n=1 Tax=Oppia nitens TaxID=1686743 RepID=UPI0023D9B4B8|nr:uncharacterized protein LOC128958326 [Oppia nitens]
MSDSEEETNRLLNAVPHMPSNFDMSSQSTSTETDLIIDEKEGDRGEDSDNKSINEETVEEKEVKHESDLTGIAYDGNKRGTTIEGITDHSLPTDIAVDDNRVVKLKIVDNKTPQEVNVMNERVDNTDIPLKSTANKDVNMISSRITSTSTSVLIKDVDNLHVPSTSCLSMETNITPLSSVAKSGTIEEKLNEIIRRQKEMNEVRNTRRIDNESELKTSIALVDTDYYRRCKELTKYTKEIEARLKFTENINADLLEALNNIINKHKDFAVVIDALTSAADVRDATNEAIKKMRGEAAKFSKFRHDMVLDDFVTVPTYEAKWVNVGPSNSAVVLAEAKANLEKMTDNNIIEEEDELISGNNDTPKTTTKMVEKLNKMSKSHGNVLHKSITKPSTSASHGNVSKSSIGKSSTSTSHVNDKKSNRLSMSTSKIPKNTDIATHKTSHNTKEEGKPHKSHPYQGRDITLHVCIGKLMEDPKPGETKGEEFACPFYYLSTSCTMKSHYARFHREVPYVGKPTNYKTIPADKFKAKALYERDEEMVVWQKIYSRRLKRDARDEKGDKEVSELESIRRSKTKKPKLESKNLKINVGSSDDDV